MRCIDFKEYRKNTLRGFFTIELSNGIQIRDCTLHQQNDKSWFGFPGIPYDKNGKTEYKNVIYIPDKTILEKMKNEVMKHMAEHLDANGTGGGNGEPQW